MGTIKIMRVFLIQMIRDFSLSFLNKHLGKAIIYGAILLEIAACTSKPVVVATKIPPTLAGTEIHQTPTPLATSQADNALSRLDSRYLLFTSWKGSSIELLSLSTGEHSVILQESAPIKFSAYDQANCAILIRPTSLSPTRWIYMNALTFNYAVFEIPGWNGAENTQWFTDVKVSPTNLFAALSVGYFSENRERDADLFDLYVVSLEPSGESIVVADAGGAEAYAWSPDGSYLAFSEFDEDQIPQVFISNYEGQNLRQITDYQSSDIHIDELTWSPDGKFIVIAYRPQSNDIPNSGGLQIFRIDAGSIQMADHLIQLGNQTIFGIYGLWWIDHETILVDIGIRDAGPYKSGLYALSITETTVRPYFGQGSNFGEMVPFEDLVLVIAGNILIYEVESGILVSEIERPPSLDIVGQTAVIAANKEGCIYYPGRN